MTGNATGDKIVVLAEIAHTLESTESSGARIVRVLELLRNILAYDRCSVVVRRAAGPELFAVPFPLPDEKAAQLTRMMAMLEGEPNAGATARSAAPDAAESHLALPLVAGEEDWGLLLVERQGSGDFDESMLRVLSIVSSQVATYAAYCHAAAQLADHIQALEGANAFHQLLMGVVSHDLRNPLTAVLMGASLLQSGRVDERDALTLQRMIRSAERSIRIINDLLDMTREQTSGAFPVSVGAADAALVTRELVEELRLVHRNREIVLVGVDEAILGVFDADRLAQAVGNLLSNALQHGGATSAVRVSVEASRETIVISVTNHGLPIDPETLPHIFDPFRRGTAASSARAPRGLGLGLYIVGQIAKAHGGTASATSSGAGVTEFRLSIPRGEA